MSRYGLIAGSGRFPLLALESARTLGHDVAVVAIREEASPEVERLAPGCHWISLGQLGRLIDILKQEGVAEVMMAGQVKHARIFSSIRPDWRLVQVLAKLRQKNTEGLIGAVAAVLRSEGIALVDSTALLKPLLADEGPLSGRKPGREEAANIAYGRRIANALAASDVGQSVAVSERACVAVEAMEGTDAMLRRAAALVNGRALVLVKVARRRGHLLFDVPVAGLDTISVMQETGTTALAVDAGRTLLLDRDQMLARAAEADIAVVGCPPEGPRPLPARAGGADPDSREPLGERRTLREE
ncbi:MAG: LpxI family protein [Acidobacteria bacterium]|nr:LpxI family protein [Acidobacteriota bacterium]